MTSTALAARNGAALDQSAADRLWTGEQQQAIRTQLVPTDANGRNKITDADLALFGLVCERAGLDPFLKQIYLIPTQQGPKIHVGIDGLRLIAARTGGMDGTDGPYWCGPDGAWREIWLENDPPAAAKYGVRRLGARGHVYAVALYREFKGTGPNWTQRPAHQLAIVAERHALRKAFQHELAGVARTLRAVHGAQVSLADDDPDGVAEWEAAPPPDDEDGGYVPSPQEQARIAAQDRYQAALDLAAGKGIRITGARFDATTATTEAFNAAAQTIESKIAEFTRG